MSTLVRLIHCSCLKRWSNNMRFSHCVNLLRKILQFQSIWCYRLLLTISVILKRMKTEGNTTADKKVYTVWWPSKRAAAAQVRVRCLFLISGWLIAESQTNQSLPLVIREIFMYEFNAQWIKWNAINGWLVEHILPLHMQRTYLLSCHLHKEPLFIANPQKYVKI